MSRKTRRRAAAQFRRSDRNLAAQHRRPRSCTLQHDAHVRDWHRALAWLWVLDAEDLTPDELALLDRPVPAEHREIIARLC